MNSTNHNQLSCDHHFLKFDKSIAANAKKASAVLIITAITMVAEIYFGYITGSMALLADGWHMATHAAALGITYLTYRLATEPKMVKNFNFGGGKIIALGGFASSVFLLCVVLLIGFESVQRFFKPEKIEFDEALLVAVIGLIINIICAYILKESHHHGHNHAHAHDHNDHSHSHDHNIRGAYLHVLADAVTSVGAIAALLAGKFYGYSFLDPLIGLIGALVIFKWALGLIRDTGWELLDGHALNVNFAEMKTRIESTGAKIIDLHVWKIAPEVLACELVLETDKPQGITHYRKILHEEFNVHHSVIEERAFSSSHSARANS
ncbi:MAG: CDF family Co(II)/Ni(II) efflux transporter DmeF [Bdellovibrionales bacterium]|nr:CDF family Co(II)/Ni(II) efflux transporter DmeF [Bdellovibrionales bacterium]